ncbi:glycoside hydrolase family 16 protein [Amniculicola lignicola CBS 123094]|uniref:endo-1,3(4)-beta-glucanase n=1 Tax=Amniculicola lignicola CBS 123094 TaxID=1392246 RepID=A0A6A5WHF8_9PLEO|nr:glycoside hydrolase family 16 protein [Amniculicola lignicola CBS 123094]
MYFRALFVSLPLLWTGVAAFPAGQGPLTGNATIYPRDDHRSIDRRAITLIETYDKSNWLSKFNVLNIADPTHGFVTYVSKAQAVAEGLLKSIGSQVYIGVDSKTVLDPNGAGRKSVRLESKRVYNRGLIIADFARIPGSNCGSWPAFWMFGPNWPNSGEIDIIEGVNLNTHNEVALHTSPGCTPTIGTGGEWGVRTGNKDCGADGGNEGCGVLSTSATSYGTGFNNYGGGVFATLWTSSGFKVWYFPTRNTPADIKAGKPDPSKWGKPAANYAGCDFDAKFKNMKIVFDITFCGDWAGAVWGESACAKKNPSCKGYVASQPTAFASSYWLVNYVKVFSV